jgi:hypothetical protein
MDYLIKNPLFDICIICKDNINVYYSKWNLAKHFTVLKIAFLDNDATELPIKEYNSDVIIKVIEWIETDYKLALESEVVDKLNNELLRQIYEFAHQYDCNKLEKYMENILKKTISLKLLYSLKDRKSSIYNEVLTNFITANNNCEIELDLDTVRRDILNDILAIHKKADKQQKNNRVETQDVIKELQSIVAYGHKNRDMYARIFIDDKKLNDTIKKLQTLI